MRVSDDTVVSYLNWARNYGEIQSFSQIAKRGRKWLVIMPEGVTFTKDGGDVGVLTGQDGIVPDELVLTSREALVFGYGLAVAGARVPRRVTAERRWGW